MEPLIVTLITLVAIWVIACVSLFVHANTQDKTIANYKAYGTRLVLERDTLAKSVEELLQAFNTVTAERDTLRTMLYASNTAQEELRTERDRLMLAHIAISDNTENVCQYCDAVDSYNFGQCESCGEQDHE